MVASFKRKVMLVTGGGLSQHTHVMYPRDAPVRLLGLVRAGLLSLDHFHVDTFSLSEVNAAVEHAAATAGPFRMTIIRPC